VTFAYITGWRASEVKGLQWSQVDLVGRTVRLNPGTTKNDEGRVFPFTRELETVLLAQRDASRDLQRRSVITPWVFHRADGSPIRCLRKAWHTACRTAGCPGRILHDFRRTAVRNLERAGVPRSVAMAMVGHKTEAMYRRYAIVSASDLTRAARQLDEVSGILSGILPARVASGGGSDERFAQEKLAGSTGLEPAASGVTGRRSNQLNYDPESCASWSPAYRPMTS